MAKVTNEGAGKFNCNYPTLAVIVTAQANGRENAMTVAWHASISFNPPLYGISISSKRFTYQLIVDSKEFGVNFLPLEQAEIAASVGGCRGQEIDKFQRFNIATEKALKTAVPVLKAAYAAYECKLVDDRDYGDHRWLVGEVVAVHLLEEAFSSEAALKSGKAAPLLYLGNEHYVTAAKDTIRRLDRKVYGSR